MYWTRCMSRDKIISVIPPDKWPDPSSLIWRGATAWSRADWVNTADGPWCICFTLTGQGQSTDYNFAGYISWRELWSQWSLLLSVHVVTVDQSCPNHQLIRFPANLWSNIDGCLSFKTKCAFVCSERTYSCIKLTINLYILFKKCNFGFLSNPNPIILDCQVSLLWTIAKKFW